MTTLAFPFGAGLDGRSQTPAIDEDARIRDLLELLVFTTPGERVMRGQLGSPVRQLVFESISDTTGVALQVALQASINLWLGELLELRALTVESEAEGQLVISIAYESRRSRLTQTVQLRRDRT